MLNSHICAHCTNAYREVCVTECAATGDYCAFTPRPLRDGEQPPQFPIADFLEMTAREARVLTGLCLYWQSQHQMMAGSQPSARGNGHGQPIYLRGHSLKVG